MNKILSRVRDQKLLGYARKIYLIAATGSFLAVIGCLIVAGFFYLEAISKPTQLPVPSVKVSQTPNFNVNDVGKYLEAPSGIRFIPTKKISKISTDTILGHFEAKTLNHLAKYPNDFDIIGGKSADLFDKVLYKNGVSGLRPTKKLVDQVHAMEKKSHEEITEEYNLQVISTDKYGLVSSPENVKFSISYINNMKDTSGAKSTNKETSSAVAPSELSPLQKLARHIAQTIDPKITPLYFSVYDDVQNLPRKCGASPDNEAFVSGIRASFNNLGNKITKQNLALFYVGVCSEWKQVLSSERMARQKAAAERNSIISRNQQMYINSEIKKKAASMASAFTLGLAGYAFIGFLFISMLLAIMSIESHTREAKESMREILNSKSKMEYGS